MTKRFDMHHNLDSNSFSCGLLSLSRYTTESLGCLSGCALFAVCLVNGLGNMRKALARSIDTCQTPHRISDHRRHHLQLLASQYASNRRRGEVSTIVPFGVRRRHSYDKYRASANHTGYQVSSLCKLTGSMRCSGLPIASFCSIY